MAKRDISDGICAYLQGGLGNQLFIYAAAYAESRRLKCNLYVDISKYSKRDPLDRHKETFRKPELVTLGLPGEVIDEDSPWSGNSPRRPAFIRIPGNNSRNLSVFRETAFGYNASIAQIEPGTTLYGYFQSYKYFQHVSQKIEDELLACKLSLPDQEAVNTLGALNNTHAHVRRGDYVDPIVAAHHGIASADYFERSKSLMDVLNPETSMTVFTDSPELVQKEFHTIKEYSIFDDSELSSFGAIRALSQGSSLIMSNSSFSWWAAWLMTRGNSKTVIAPRPWQSNGSSAADLLLPEWITLDAR